MTDKELDQLLDTWQAPLPSPSLRRIMMAALPPPPPHRVLGIRLRWVVAAMLGAGGLAVGAAVWTDPKLGSFWGTAGDVHTRTTRMVDPPSAKIRWWMKGGGHSIGETPAGIRGSGFLRDRSAAAFYGYKYTAEPIGNGYFHVEFQPLDENIVHGGSPFKKEGRIQTITLSPPKTVRDGEFFDVDLFVGNGDRVFDRVEISTRPFPKEPLPPQDPLRLTLDRARVYENGSLVGRDDRSIGGACMWFHVADQGRYLFALNPMGNPLFAPAGKVNGAAMEFTSGNRTFRLESASPIAKGGEHTLYVFHQQSFEGELKDTRLFLVGNAGPVSMHR